MRPRITGVSRSTLAICASSAVLLAVLAPSVVLARTLASSAQSTASRSVTGPTSVTVFSGDMADSISWSAPAGVRISRFEVYRGPSATGPWTLVASPKSTARSYKAPVTVPGAYHYRVMVMDTRRMRSRPTTSVANTAVRMSKTIGTAGGTMRSSNGEISLAFGAGDFAAPSTVRVSDATGEPRIQGTFAASRNFDIDSSEPLASPARLTLRYHLRVTQFQVRASLARAIEMATRSAAASEWTTVTTSVDTTAGTFSSDVSHFSYWSGVTIQPHGTSPSNTSYCDGVCHNLVDAPGSSNVIASRSADVCYFCHGNTNAGDAPAGATGPNVQGEMFACTGQTYDPATNARHPVADGDLYCTLCHNPHRSPEDAPGLLRTADAVTLRPVESKNGVSAGIAFCGSCHGTRYQRNVNSLVPGYYARTGGDRLTGFAGSAHEALATGTTSVACDGCHNEHGSDNPEMFRADLMDSSDATAGSIPDARHRASCYGCHSGSRAATSSWNGRDIRADFARASRHPATTGSASDFETELVIAFEQTSKSEFDVDTQFQVASDPYEGVRIGDGSWPETYPVKNLLFAQNAGSGLIDQFDPVTKQWNSMGYTPAPRPENLMYGGGSFVVNGKPRGITYVSGGYYNQWTHTPAAGSDMGTSTFDGGAALALGPGASSAEDTSHGWVYVVWAGMREYISKYSIAGNNYPEMIQMVSPQAGWGYGYAWQYYGSASAYSAQSDRLFILNRSRDLGADGHLWYIPSPSTKSGEITPVDSGQTLTPGNGDHAAAMKVAKVGGTDYLFVLAPNLGGTYELRVVSNLGAGSPAVTSTGKTPWVSSYLYAVDLTWDGGEYLYAGGNAALARIRIPADPVAGVWPEWEILPGSPHGGSGLGLEFANAQAPPRTVYGYESAGSISAEVQAPDGSDSWGRLTWVTETPAGTSVTVRVRGWDGSTWVDVPGMSGLTSGQADLGAYSTTTYGKLQLTADLVTLDRTITPRLKEWRVTAVKSYPVVSGTVRVPVVTLYDSAPAPGFDQATVHSSAPTTQSTATQTVDPPPKKLLFALDSGSGQMKQYDPAIDRWNAWGYIPNEITGGQVGQVIADGFTTGTAVYWPRLQSKLGFVKMPLSGTPSATLLGGPYISENRPDGSDAAWDEVRGLVYAIRGEASATVTVYNPVTQSQIATYQVFDPATGKPLWYGESGHIAYSPQADKLFIAESNTWHHNPAGGAFPVGSGKLFSVSAPRLRSGSVIASTTGVNGGVVGASTYNAYPGDLTRFSRGGEDYLACFAYQGAYKFFMIGNLTSTVQTTSPAITPPRATSSWHQMAYNWMTIVWDGADRLYTDGTWWPSMPQQQMLHGPIPANPMDATAGNWGPWSVCTTTTWYAGAPSYRFGFSFATATVPTQQVQGYDATSVQYSPEVTPTAGAAVWGVARWATTSTAGVTSATITVQGWNGSSWVDLSGLTGLTAGPADLHSLTTAAWSKLRYKATLHTSDMTKTAKVVSYSITCGSGDGLYVTGEALPVPTAEHWHLASVASIQPPGTAVTYDVQGWQGGTWVTVPGFSSVSTPTVDLSALHVADWPKLRLAMHLDSSWEEVPPTVQSATLSCTRIDVHAVGSLTCASCHDAHRIQRGSEVAWDAARVSDPRDTRLVYGATYGDGVTGFCLRCHSAAAVRATPAKVPYDVLFSRWPNSAYFPGWDKTTAGAAFTQSGHYTTSGTKALCQNCHDPHGSDSANLTAWTRPSSFTTGLAGTRDNVSGAAAEENLCLQCHGNGTKGKQAPGAQDVATPMSSGAYGHPIGSSDLHADYEPTSSLGAGNRHSECVDCHDPHAAVPGTHLADSSLAGGALRGAIGVKPTWPGGAGTTATAFTKYRFTGTNRDMEAYLCFKCHSKAADLPAAGPSGMTYTDLTLEFNPANQSYHNVLGLELGARTSFVVYGNTYAWPYRGAFKAGWNTNSKMTCTSCHSNESAGGAKGPHGSSAKFIIDPQYSGDFANASFVSNNPKATSPGNLICNKCHDFVAGTNPVHGYKNGVNVYLHTRKCTDCHIKIPHGWKRPRMIGYQSDPQPYATNPGTGITAMEIRQHADGWLGPNCEANGCSSYMHPTGCTGSVWP